MSLPGTDIVMKLAVAYLKLPEKKRKASAAFYRDLSAWMRRTAAALRGNGIPAGLSKALSVWLEGAKKVLKLEESLSSPKLSTAKTTLLGLIGQQDKAIASVMDELQKSPSPSGDVLLALGALAGVDANSPLRDIASQLEGTASQLDAWVALLDL